MNLGTQSKEVFSGYKLHLFLLKKAIILFSLLSDIIIYRKNADSCIMFCLGKGFASCHYFSCFSLLQGKECVLNCDVARAHEKSVGLYSDRCFRTAV